jgi:hypothetical protein
MGAMDVGRRGTNECEMSTKDNSIMMMMVTSLVVILFIIENGETGVGVIVLQIMSLLMGNVENSLLVGRIY